MDLSSLNKLKIKCKRCKEWFFHGGRNRKYCWECVGKKKDN